MEQTDKSGRRKRLDPVKTRVTILQAAFSNFANGGFEGASIANIAKSAGVPKSLVQYHFGSKEELWEACLLDKAAPMMAAVDRFLGSDSADPRELIAARFSFLKENPEMRRMLFWAGMSPGPLPGFILERRGKVLQKFSGNAKSPQFARFLAALAAVDGWFLFRNFYRGPFGDAVFDEDIEQMILDVALETVGEK